MTLTDDEKSALLDVIEDGIADQEEYLREGNPSQDYGDDLDDTKQLKIDRYNALASALRKLGAEGLAEDAEAMAATWEAL